MVKNNRVPRQFNRIVIEMLTNTSYDKCGDILHIYKNDSGYLGLNKRTGKYAYVFVSMLRNANYCKILEIDR